MTTTTFYAAHTRVCNIGLILMGNVNNIYFFSPLPSISPVNYYTTENDYYDYDYYFYYTYIVVYGIVVHYIFPSRKWFLSRATGVVTRAHARAHDILYIFFSLLIRIILLLLYNTHTREVPVYIILLYFERVFFLYYFLPPLFYFYRYTRYYYTRIYTRGYNTALVRLRLSRDELVN